MVSRYLFLSAIALSSAFAAVSLVPGDFERVAMLERDGRYEEAMQSLDQQYANGRRDGRLMIGLFNLKLRFGLIEQAQNVLEEYARARPKDTQAQLGLVRFYQSTQQEDAYLRNLKALAERLRSRDLNTELLGYYRLSGRFRDEEELLDRLARTNRAGPAEYERLGLLSASRGELVKAARALRRADGRLDENSLGARMSLFRILIELKDYDEAHDRAVAWLQNWRVPSVIVDFMTALSDTGRVDLAIDLGDRFGVKGSEVTLVAAELLTLQNKNADAQAKIKEFIANGMPEERDLALRLIAAAIDCELPDVALASARNLGLRKIPGELVVDLMEAVRDASGEEGLEKISPLALAGFSLEIDARLNNTAPVGEEAADSVSLTSELRLLASSLAARDGDNDLARRHLAAVDPDKLDTDDLTEWTDLQLKLGLRESAFPNLAKVAGRQGIAAMMARRLSQSAVANATDDPQAPNPGVVPTGAPSSAVGTPSAIAPKPSTKGQTPKWRKIRHKERVVERYKLLKRREKALAEKAGKPGGADGTENRAAKGPSAAPTPQDYGLNTASENKPGQ